MLQTCTFSELLMQKRDSQKKYIHAPHTKCTGIRVEKACILYIHGENNDKANQKETKTLLTAEGKED